MNLATGFLNICYHIKSFKATYYCQPCNFLGNTFLFYSNNTSQLGGGGGFA